MNGQRRLAAATLLAFLLWSTHAAAQGSVAGIWTGGFDGPLNRVPMMVVLDPQPDSLRGAMFFLLEQGRKSTVTAELPRGGRVVFASVRGADTLRFFGVQHADTILGTMTIRDHHSPFQMVRFYQLAPERVDRLEGDYRDADGRYLVIKRLGSLLRYEDYGTGRFGLMYPSSDSTFFGGPSYLTFYPDDVRVHFHFGASGEVEGLRLLERTRPAREATREKRYAESEVLFMNDKLKLAASLFTPEGPGPHPAIVLVHGSGQGDRIGFDAYPNLLALQGFAVLAMDKRGTGRSGKGGISPSFEDYADDVLAAVRFLKTLSEVDSTRIGLLGLSQGGGYTAPIAASKSKDIAFLVDLSGSNVTPAEENLFQNEYRMKRAGFGDETVARANALQMRLHGYTRTGGTHDEIVAALEAARGERWYSQTNLPGNPAMELAPEQGIKTSWWHQNLDLDRMPFWEKVTCPVLALYGDADEVSPVREGIARLEKALSRGANPRHGIELLPGASHALWQTNPEHPGDSAWANRYSPKFLPLLEEFLGGWLSGPRPPGHPVLGGSSGH